MDDHVVVRRGLGMVLSSTTTFSWWARPGNGEEAIRLCERFQPDVVLMDLLMPKMDGVAATKAIKERWPETKVIALTSFKEKEYVEGALKAGASGYLLKNVSAEEPDQRHPQCGGGAAQPLAGGGPGAHPEGERAATPGQDMTEREREILALMVEGLSNNEIAERLVVSPSTAKFHVTNVLSKLGVATRTEAVVMAVKNNLVK